jgi:hypothetical protein
MEGDCCDDSIVVSLITYYYYVCGNWGLVILTEDFVVFLSVFR